MSYKYTLLNQDGTAELLAQTDKEVELKQLYDWLNCQIVELIPEPYHNEIWKSEETIVWGDEEARFNPDNKRNLHTKVLTDFEGNEWDCVGDLILQQEI